MIVKYLFIHQNFPAQFRHIAAQLAQDPENEVVYITHPEKGSLTGVRKVEYRPHRKPDNKTHPYLRDTEEAVIYGQGVARKALELKQEGFVPDIIIGHPGWGETLFIKDVFQDSPLLSYCEFYYSARGADVGFDPDYPVDFDTICRTRVRNAQHLLAIEAADACYSPTDWQKSQFPKAFQSKISVIHDGIDCKRVCPKADAVLNLSRGGRLKFGDEIVTYVARNLEPYRGFPSFMRALAKLQKLRPQCRALIVGGDDVSYGRKPPNGTTHKEIMLKELDLDLSRVHFLGKVSYQDYLTVLQVSGVHIYLTYPFVLSWSMLEAMAAGCVVIGSRTPPVEEVIVNGENGYLVDFFSPEELAERTASVLSQPDTAARIRKDARETILSYFELGTCRNKLLGLANDLIQQR